jgi:hypothetical protein
MLSRLILGLSVVAAMAVTACGQAYNTTGPTPLGGSAPMSLRAIDDGSGTVATSANAPSSQHTLATPTDLQASVSGTTVTLTWNGDWTEYASGGNNDATFGHFEVYRDGTKIADVKTGTYADSGLADGTYQYAVKSMSRTGNGKTTMTYHSELTASVQAVVSGTIVYTIGNFNQNCANGTLNNGGFTIGFQLFADGALVTTDQGLTNAGGPNVKNGSEVDVNFSTEGSRYSSNAGKPDTSPTAYEWIIQLNGVTVGTISCEDAT